MMKRKLGTGGCAVIAMALATVPQSRADTIEGIWSSPVLAGTIINPVSSKLTFFDNTASAVVSVSNGAGGSTINWGTWSLSGITNPPGVPEPAGCAYLAASFSGTACQAEGFIDKLVLTGLEVTGGTGGFISNNRPLPATAPEPASYPTFRDFRLRAMTFLTQAVPRNWHAMCNSVTDNSELRSPKAPPTSSSIGARCRGATFSHVRGGADAVAGRSLRSVRRRSAQDALRDAAAPLGGRLIPLTQVAATYSVRAIQPAMLESRG